MIIFEALCKTVQRGTEADALRGGFAAVHQQVAVPVGGFELYRDAHLLGKLLRRLGHVGIVPAAEVIHPAGQGEGGT